MSSAVPTVVLVGRTNVGKSTLFNRLIETRKALVSDVAGTTRDRNEGMCLWRGKMVRVVDTGGLDIAHADEIERNIIKQAQLAIKAADVILFLVDLKTGAMPADRELASRLRKSGKPVIVVGNKAEKAQERLGAMDSQWRMEGLGEPMPVSSVRGTGVGDLLDAVYDRLYATGRDPVDPLEVTGARVAVIGKPNVGKSTLLNALLGEERFITSPIAHTTREPNDTVLTREGKTYIFIDTAGMRKRAKVNRAGGLEQAAVERNEAVVRMADVTLLVVDATEPMGVQEKTLAGFLKESDSGVIVVVNKWDLVAQKKTDTMDEYREYIAATLPFLAWAPVVFLSALTHQRVHTLFGLIDRVAENRGRELDEAQLKTFVERAIGKHRPTIGKGPSAPKVLGLEQVSTRPPRFDLHIKARRTDALSVSYVRFLENQLRAMFDLEGTPVHMRIRVAK